MRVTLLLVAVLALGCSKGDTSPARQRVVEVGGKEVAFELGGLVDGIDPRHITEDPALASRFAAADGPVPVLISPSLLELYNTRYASVHGLPVIGALEEHLATRNPLRFTITLGETTVPGSAGARTGAAPRAIEAQLVGISAAAMPIGLSVPIEQVRRWNREYVGEEAATSSSSLTVTLKDERRLAAFDAWLGERNLRIMP